MKQRHINRGVFVDFEREDLIFSAEIQTTNLSHVIGHYKTAELAKAVYDMVLDEMMSENKFVSRAKLISNTTYKRSTYGWQSILRYRKRKYSCGIYNTKAKAYEVSFHAMAFVSEYELDWGEIMPSEILSDGLTKIKERNKEILIKSS